MGVLALAAAPADAPVPDRRAPVVSFPTTVANQVPVTGSGAQLRKTVPLP